jgi:hypothetical protein
MEPTPEQEAYLKKLADRKYYGEQDENGVDLLLLDMLMDLPVAGWIARGAEREGVRCGGGRLGRRVIKGDGAMRGELRGGIED